MREVIDKMIVEKRDFAMFEDDMIRHSKLFVFQKNDHYTIGDGSMMIIQFKSHSMLPTLKASISSQYFTKAHFILFLNQLIELKKICVEYRLEFEKIDFSSDTARLDDAQKCFIWRYIPVNHAYVPGNLCDLLRQIIIESEALSRVFHIADLKEASMTPEHLVGVIEQLSKPSKAFSMRSLFSKNKETHVTRHSPQSKKTMHTNHYPMLINKANPTESYKLFFTHNTIGRAEDSNIHIDDASISRRHATIYKEGVRHYIKDLGSTNGTWLSGHKVITEKEVENGETIQLGDKEFIFIR